MAVTCAAAKLSKPILIDFRSKSSRLFLRNSADSSALNCCADVSNSGCLLATSDRSLSPMMWRTKLTAVWIMDCVTWNSAGSKPSSRRRMMWKFKNRLVVAATAVVFSPSFWIGSASHCTSCAKALRREVSVQFEQCPASALTFRIQKLLRRSSASAALLLQFSSPPPPPSMAVAPQKQEQHQKQVRQEWQVQQLQPHRIGFAAQFAGTRYPALVDPVAVGQISTFQISCPWAFCDLKKIM